MKINQNIILTYKDLIFLFLFCWFSFFAPWVEWSWHQRFLGIFLILLVFILIIRKNLLIFVFCREEVPFWFFYLFYLAGLVNPIDSQIANYYFWSFVFPIPILYFSAKIFFEKENCLNLIRVICIIAFFVLIFGVIEFITKQSLISNISPLHLYYDAFVGRRMISTQAHPTCLGTYFLACFPFGLFLYLVEKNKILKLSAIIYMIGIFIGLIFSFSRGVLIGLFFVLLFFTNFMKKKRLLTYLLILLVVIIIFSSFLAKIAIADFWRYSLSNLLTEWIYVKKFIRVSAVFNILKDHPIFGLGFGHYRVMFNYYLPNHPFNMYDDKVADLMYVTLLAETGLIGFTGFFLYLFFLFRRVIKKIYSVFESNQKILLICFFSSFVGIMFSFLTYDGLYWITPNYLFWSYAGVLSSLSTRAEGKINKDG